MWRLSATWRCVELFQQKHGIAIHAVDSPSMNNAILHCFSGMPATMVAPWSHYLPLVVPENLYGALRTFVYRHGMFTKWQCRSPKATPQEAGVRDHVSDRLFFWWSRGAESPTVE